MKFETKRMAILMGILAVLICGWLGTSRAQSASQTQSAAPAQSGSQTQSAYPTPVPPPAQAGAQPQAPTAYQGAALYQPKPVTPEESSAERKEYADKVRESYNFHFGKGDISTPGNAAVEGNDFIQPGAFPKATYCKACHAQAYDHWRQALHSNSFRTPFYRTSVNILRREKGIEFTRHCESCHNPIATLTGALTQDSKSDRHYDEDGLTCLTCHAIQKLQPTVGNGGYVMGVPSVMVDENGKRIPGEVPYMQIMEHPERHSKAVMKDFLRTPEFCAACHKANLPAPLNDYKFVRAFTVYDEWHNSKFSKRNPLTFYSGDFTTCQGCHMKRAAPELEEYGAKNGTFASHRWTAGNTAVPFYYGFDKQLEKTIEFLKSGNYLNVDLFAIKKADGEGMVAPLGSASFNLKPNDNVQTLLVIQNKNIGHSLIPEVRDLYEAWVEFAVNDGDGKEIYHSGFLKPDGMLEPRAHSFTNRPVTEKGEFVDNHKVFTIHSVAYDNTIQAGRSGMVRYEFKIPADAKGPLTVVARVNYRHLRQSYLNNIFGKDDHPAYPVIEIASRTRTLNIGENPAAAPDPQDNQDWMRWNNYGIASLDQLQYADAINAFAEVVKLRPDYADGYTNIGLTNIEWEKYGSARASLEKALQLSPDNARALYYMALVERRAGHPDIEEADLLKVVTQYPLSRDARRELGKSFYRQHKEDKAIEQFEALQAIDPDDVTAHYNLSILYGRKGMEAKAAEQAALFVTKKVDPGAPTYSLDFLLKHPEIQTESVPWHMHSDLHPEYTAGPPQYPKTGQK
jgi:Tfp pilus assembly protein PilF